MACLPHLGQTLQRAETSLLEGISLFAINAVKESSPTQFSAALQKTQVGCLTNLPDLWVVQLGAWNICFNTVIHWDKRSRTCSQSL